MSCPVSYPSHRTEKVRVHEGAAHVTERAALYPLGEDRRAEFPVSQAGSLRWF